MLTLNFNDFIVRDGALVVDLGCGEGRHAIHAYLEANATVIGLDQSEQDLRTAQLRAAPFIDAERAASLTYMKGDAHHLPFADESIDAVICSEVLEHIEHYQSVIQEIARVLKPGGQLMVSVPRYWPEKICWMLSEPYHQVEGGHVRIFKEKQLKHSLQAQDFIFNKKHFAHALHSPYWWLKCLFWKTQDTSRIIQMYHRFLVWDLMDKPAFTRMLEKLLNPICGKSVVMYFTKRPQS